MGQQHITRKGNFDSAHRVMDERMKCFNIHGHTYIYELTFSFSNSHEIGYAIDFKEIKRVFQQWIDDCLDHGAILNFKDEEFKKLCLSMDSKMWVMSLNGMGQYCNPTVENIAKEVFLAMRILCSSLYPDERIGLSICKVRIYETPNCYTDCFYESISFDERKNFYFVNEQMIIEYAHEKGIIEYDQRKHTKWAPGVLINGDEVVVVDQNGNRIKGVKITEP